MSSKRWMAGVYYGGLGAALFGAWTVDLLRQGVPEVRTEGPHFLFVFGAELVAVELLLAASVGLLKHQPWADSIMMIAVGMFAYSALNHVGAWVQAEAYAAASAGALSAFVAVLLMVEVRSEEPRRKAPTEWVTSTTAFASA